MFRFMLFSKLMALTLFMTTNVFAQTPVKWTFEAKHLGGPDFELIYKANIEKGWAVYSQFLASNDGPVKTSINYDSKNFTLNGKATEAGNKMEGFDEMFNMTITKFKYPDFTISQKVRVTDATKPIKGYVTFMTCDDKRCLPPKDIDFSLDVSKAISTGAKPSNATTTAVKPSTTAKPKKKRLKKYTKKKTIG